MAKCKALMGSAVKGLKLKFRKDPIRGVDEIDSIKATFATQMPSPYRRWPITTSDHRE